MRTARARLNIEVNVNCPHCDELIDLMDERDTNGDDLNEDGHILNQACPNGNWSEKHPSFDVSFVTCTECKNTFNVKELEW